jgi:hypothetical protein
MPALRTGVANRAGTVQPERGSDIREPCRNRPVCGGGGAHPIYSVFHLSQ